MGCTHSTAVAEVTTVGTGTEKFPSTSTGGSRSTKSTTSTRSGLDDVQRTTSKTSETSRASVATSASEMSTEQHKISHERLRKLRELDDSTKIPFILVELRGHGDRDGYIEICGKDEYGVYAALEKWLTTTWQCKKLDAGDLSDDTPVPFSDALYRWEGFLAQGTQGTNNMGLATMQLVDFMCGQLSWTLGVINGGNVGPKGEIREQQIIFKAPHPMNMVAEHVMVELRSAGYIEICGKDSGAMDTLHSYFTQHFGAVPIKGHEAFSDRFYHCQSGVFKERGKSGENNLGMLTAKVCDAVVMLLPGWSLVTMNGGNYGDDGSHREQQLVFRWDNHPLREAPHMLVELREAGYVEVNGKDVDCIYSKLEQWLKTAWGCKDTKSLGLEAFCDKKFTWASKDMMLASSEITQFFHQLGWQMQVCSQGTVEVKGKSDCREQQILFRPGASGCGIVEPHLFIELYTGEGQEELYRRPQATQVLGNQRIRVCEVGAASAATSQISRFIEEYLGGTPADESADARIKSYHCDVFLSRGQTDNNLGCWTMRLCDFMVDRLGWSFVVCNVCNLGPAGQFREQQLVFRFDGERREIPAVKDHNVPLKEVDFVGLQFPSYWQSQKVLSLKQRVAIVSCDQDEKAALQEVFDETFKRILTRDRVYEFQLGVNEEMPYRLEVVHAFRSEHAELYRRFAERRSAYHGGSQLGIKTQNAGALLNSRIAEGEALLLHGTNPSSGMSILKTGFALNHSGKSTGTMFGNGIYLAECVSKSDEYARDDNGGTYPGLMAMLVCRSLVGNPYVVQDPGDHIASAKAAGCDCVVGDREAKVGTYREFVFFDERQVVPEYTVIYRRQYNQTAVPQLMRQGTKGTTGRNWQVKLEKGWANIPPDVSHELNQAEMSGTSTVNRMVADVVYLFDLSTMQQTNMDTGKSRQIRPPMRR